MGEGIGSASHDGNNPVYSGDEMEQMAHDPDQAQYDPAQIDDQQPNYAQNEAQQQPTAAEAVAPVEDAKQPEEPREAPVNA